MPEIKRPLIDQGHDIYAITSKHSASDVLNHLIEVDGLDEEDLITILEMRLEATTS